MNTNPKAWLTGLFLWSLAVVVGCQSPAQEEAAVEVPRSGLYQASELATTMRDMAKDMESLRVKADEGTLTVEEVEGLMQTHQSMATDAPTKPADIKPSFAGYSEAYLTQLEELRTSIEQQASREDRLAAFNAAISTCVSCHQEHCPGPISRIQKIKVQP
ncbi:MAG: hypothetical protein RL168_819 [Bacteroidota bacterium]|jgi:cytochrome c553